MNIYSLKIGGAAGQGIKSAGAMLSKVTTRSGFHIYTYTEYPSLIRGGHNVIQLLISKEPVLSPSQKINLLVALNQETLDLHLGEIVPGGAILCDCDAGFDKSKAGADINELGVPLSKLAEESGGGELAQNTVAIGAVVAFLGGSLKILKDLIEEEFAGKDSQLIASNQAAAGAGFAFIQSHFSDKIQDILKPMDKIDPKIVVDGNDAISIGAVSSGMQFASIYPMTPITSILTNLASWQEKYGFIFKQPEDELAAINMAIGASYAGARAMTATSGGGFCLMTEGISLAGMAEIPIVVVLGMRPGPSTGMPTWSEQGDLQFALHSGHGDFPRIVLAAGDGEEAFRLTKEAFYLAEKYRTPVILITDKNLSENTQSFTPFPSKSDHLLGDTHRLMSTSSDEHDENGFSVDDVATRNKMMEKRMKKLETCMAEDMEKPQLFGPETADLTIVSWGSNKGAILEALKGLPDTNFLHITWMNPFPADEVKKILGNAKNILDVECNFSGQLVALISEKCGIEIKNKLLKYDGRPIYPEEIIQHANA